MRYLWFSQVQPGSYQFSPGSTRLIRVEREKNLSPMCSFSSEGEISSFGKSQFCREISEGCCQLNYTLPLNSFVEWVLPNIFPKYFSQNIFWYLVQVVRLLSVAGKSRELPSMVEILGLSRSLTTTFNGGYKSISILQGQNYTDTSSLLFQWHLSFCYHQNQETKVSIRKQSYRILDNVPCALVHLLPPNLQDVTKRLKDIKTCWWWWWR